MNYMPEIAKMLGVEIGEKFKIEYADGSISNDTYYLDETTLIEISGYKSRYVHNLLVALLNGVDSIVKIPKPILTDKEKKWLSGVIEPFRDNVEYIRKSNFIIGECIEIKIYSDIEDRHIPLPLFNKGTYYKDMELNKEYSLEELGL